MDVFDVLVGINLLREGLDIPEIQLVAILDADKEGFLRSETSLIQTIGRAARNAEGHGHALRQCRDEYLSLFIRYFPNLSQQIILIEAQRISERTHFDIEMLRETGFCSGIENYSMHLNGLQPMETPMTLMDYFPDDFLIIVDESNSLRLYQLVLALELPDPFL